MEPIDRLRMVWSLVRTREHYEEAMDLHRDFKDSLAEFDRFGVEFALLGGYAEQAAS
jgi:hypothetical protein